MTTIDDVKKEMQKTVDHFQDELKSLRTNRPSPSMLDSVTIEVYGTAMRLRDLATVSVSDGNQLVISPFDPTNTNTIANGIEKANLNLLPAVDGSIIRVPIPPMSEERRREIARDAKDKAEKAKVTIRDHRRKGNDAAKKQKADGDITEDQQKRTEKLIQESTDKFCKQVDDLFTAKEKDILEV